MIGIPLLNHEERPDWWPRFIEDITPPRDRQHLSKWERYGSWVADVDAKLQLHGGAIHRMRRGNDWLITFRLDSNYTMFMLKYA